jgi:hypothetical protein
MITIREKPDISKLDIIVQFKPRHTFVSKKKQEVDTIESM